MQREKLLSGWKEDRMFVGKSSVGHCIARREPEREYLILKAYVLGSSEDEITVLDG